MSDLPANSVEAVERDIDERQALFNAATAITRLATKSHRHPKTRALLLAKAEEFRAAAVALLDNPAAVAAAMQERRDGVGEGWVPVEKLVRLADEAKARRDAYPAHPHWEAWHLYEQDIRDIIGSARTPTLADEGLAGKVRALIAAKSFGVSVPGKRNRTHNGAHDVVMVDDLRALLADDAPEEQP